MTAAKLFGKRKTKADHKGKMMAKAKATQPNSALLSSIPKRGRNAIARIMEEPGGRLALTELLARNWDYETLFGGGQDAARIIKDAAVGLAQQHQWTLEQALTALRFSCLMQDLREVAIARRFTLDDPAELGRGVAVLSRLRWVEGQLRHHSTATGESVLEALAVRDTAVAMRLAAGDPLVSQAAEGEELEFLDLMTLAVLAASRGDESAIGDAARRMGVGKLRPWQEGIRQCFTGLANQSPTDVAGGLTGFLEGLRSLRQKDDLEEAISLTAHGLYRLCERADPTLIAGFDIAESLPWDNGFHAWTSAHPDPLPGLDLAGVSPALQDAVVGLNPPTL